MFWWTVLYLIPLFICMLGCVWIVKVEKKTTRRHLLCMLLIFVPIINFMLAIAAVVGIIQDKRTQEWLDGVIIDHTKTEEPPK